MGIPEDPGGTSGSPTDQDAQQLFVKTVKQSILTNFLSRKIYNDSLYTSLTLAVARATNTTWDPDKTLATYIGDDFEKCLVALVACYQVLQQYTYATYAQQFNTFLVDLITECCQTLGLHWEAGKFVRQ